MTSYRKIPLDPPLRKGEERDCISEEGEDRSGSLAKGQGWNAERNRVELAVAWGELFPPFVKGGLGGI